MKTISRYIMTLALLLTAVTGAWAEEKSETISTTTSQDVYTGEHFKITPNRQYGGFGGLGVADIRRYEDGQVYFSVETLDGQNISKLDLQIDYIDDTSIDNLSLSSGTKSYDSNTKVLTITNVNDNFVQITLSDGDEYGIVTISSVTYYYEESPAEAPVTVEWTASTKTGTFAMPGSDVVLTPIYAKAAAFATTGTEPEVKTLLPAAAEGVIAGTDASLIAEGTGIVAPAGTSTDVKQGTLMYAIGTSATEAPDAFSATVPTAKNVADDGADVYVWYYIKGADTPDGQQATEDNTFNDTEPACLTVTVLTNKFNIQFNAANANTIEAGKATVTVDGAAATVTEGKLEGVKMGSEVKVKAKEGYKFRKVEVKKKAAAVRPLAEATAEDLGKIAGADGNIYDTKAAAEAAGTTAVAMIAYVGSSTEHATYTHGMALALSDEGEMNWSNAKSTCEGKSAVSGAAWLLPSRNQWKAMFKANGGNEGSYTGLNTAVATAGGDSSKLQKNERYWSSSEQGSNFAWVLVLGEDNAGWDGAPEDLGHHVRACLAF